MEVHLHGGKVDELHAVLEMRDEMFSALERRYSDGSVNSTDGLRVLAASLGKSGYGHYLLNLTKESMRP